MSIIYFFDVYQYLLCVIKINFNVFNENVLNNWKFVLLLT